MDTGIISEADSLDPKLWDGDTLRPEVRRSLVRIGMNYYQSLELESEAPVDILFVGSSAGYTYTPESDIDVHVLLDSDRQPSWGNEPLMAYALAKAALWNRRHNVTVRGRKVEVYAHDIRGAGEDLRSSAIFSLFKNDWVSRQPEDLKSVPAEAVAEMNRVLLAWASAVRSRMSEGSSDAVDFAIKAIYAIRHEGLQRGGEIDPYNLAFKRVRAKGLLDTLKDAQLGEEDGELALEWFAR